MTVCKTDSKFDELKAWLEPFEMSPIKYTLAVFK
jgi:hypothetical protein